MHQEASRYVCCHHCDEINRIPFPHTPGRYQCAVCGHTLFRFWPGMVEKILALHLAAALLFALGVFYPLFRFQLLGNEHDGGLLRIVHTLYETKQYTLAVTVLLTVLILPFMRIVLHLLLFGPLYLGKTPPLARSMLKTLEAIQPWAMLDVFLIAVLVSIVKLTDAGEISTGVPLWSFALMVMLLAYAQSLFDPHLIWERIEKDPSTLPKRSVAETSA